MAYKKLNYSSVERSDVHDKRAIVSIIPEAESFTIRYMGKEEAEDEELDLQMDSDAKKLGRRKKKRKKTKDL